MYLCGSLAGFLEREEGGRKHEQVFTPNSQDVQAHAKHPRVDYEKQRPDRIEKKKLRAH